MTWNHKNYLMHHGIKGQKWGVWNDETRLRYAGGKRNIKAFSTENISGAKMANIDKWGKDESHNVLYITGLSGSGKSTVAESFRDDNTNIIHLDFYLTDGNSRYTNAYRDKEFTKHLNEKVPDFFKYYIGSADLSELSMEDRKKHWKALDDFSDAIDSFGKEQYAKGKSVVVEGVQLIDETIYPVKDVYKGKPFMIVGTDIETSTKRGAERDEIDASDIETLAIRNKWQKYWDSELDKISNTIGAGSINRDDQYLNELLERISK